ncbi:VOC family protein [Streptomyces sp. BE230]|uniref:VOC family protein n=1 Tax=Streptomyces sp. BE230 TaxID=3002526 RepID=UPI002ED54938|nr:VOC family protein [Streptomyces sp. BE230]
MAITGLDYVTLMVSSLDDTSAFLEGALGLPVEGERRQVGWGTATRAILFPGHYLEIQAITDLRGVGAARQRGLDLLASGDGWKSFGLRAQDIIRTWADLAEAGLELTPPLGQATRDSDGSYYRWWVAGQGEDFRTGRLPNLVEYESDPYRYERIPLDPPEPGAIQGVAGVDVAAEDLAEAVPAYTLLLGGPPERDHDDVMGARSARWPLPDGRYIRLLAPGDDDGLLVRHLRRRGRGVCAVAFATSDIGLATEQLSRHGIRATPTGVDGEVLLETVASLDARLTLRESPTTVHAR